MEETHQMDPWNHIKTTAIDPRTVEQIVQTMAVYQTDVMLSFGTEVLKEITKGNETIRQGQVPDSGSVFEELSHILKALDFALILEEPKFFTKLALGKKAQDYGFEKFQGLSKDLTNCYVKLKTYERQVAKYQEQLKKRLENHYAYGKKLQTYQLALAQGCQELEQHIQSEKNQTLTMPSALQDAKQMELQTLEQSLGILERKKHDFHVSEIMFFQGIPVLQGIFNSATVFLEKLQTSFLVTLPVFQQGIALGIEKKRQRLQQEAMGVLEAKTKKQYAYEEEKTLLLRGIEEIKSLEQAWKQACSNLQKN